MSTKRSRKSTTEYMDVEAAEIEIPSIEPEAIESEQGEPQEEDKVGQPRTRKCPKHNVYFPSEDEMRPMEEYTVNKTTGKLASTYCKRCNSKMHTEYGRRKRAEAAQSVERLQAIVDQKRAELAAAEEQLQYIIDLEH